MKSIRIFSLVLLSVSSVIAEEQEQAAVLPAPGTWARYQVNHKDVFNGTEAETWTVEVRFLERVKRDDKVYRWIEFQFDRSRKNEELPIQISKFLLPESELLSGKAPFRELKKFHSAQFDKQFKSPPKFLSSLSPDDERFLVESRILHGSFGVYLQALSSRRKFSQLSEDPITIDCLKGSIACTDKLTGLVEGLEPELRPRLQESWDANYELWVSDQVPTGFAAGLKKSFRTIYLPEKQAPVVVTDSLFSWSLVDFGTGAKSKLPDHN